MGIATPNLLMCSRTKKSGARPPWISRYASSQECLYGVYVLNMLKAELGPRLMTGCQESRALKGLTVPKNMEPSRVSLLITGVAYLPSGMIFADEIFIYNVWMTV